MSRWGTQVPLGALKGKLRQVSGSVTILPSPQQLKFNLFFFPWWLRDFLNKLRVSQFQFRRGHGIYFLAFRRAITVQASSNRQSSGAKVRLIKLKVSSTNAANASRNRLQSADAITGRRVSAQRFKRTAELSRSFSTV
jgi:hypothetical protein